MYVRSRIHNVCTKPRQPEDREVTVSYSVLATKVTTTVLELLYWFNSKEKKNKRARKP